MTMHDQCEGHMLVAPSLQVESCRESLPNSLGAYCVAPETMATESRSAQGCSQATFTTLTSESLASHRADVGKLMRRAQHAQLLGVRPERVTEVA